MSVKRSTKSARTASAAVATKPRKPAKPRAKSKARAGAATKSQAAVDVMPTTIQEAFMRIRNNTRIHDDDYMLRFSEAALPGEKLVQGDLYITKLAELPADCVEDKSPSLQLAPGNTKGSRHTLDSLEGVTKFRRRSPNALQGPILKLKKDRVVPHPEHKYLGLTSGSIYEVTYQRRKGERLERVWD